MKNILFLLATLIAISCIQQPHFISDTAYLKTVKQDFEQVKKMASNRHNQLFDVFDQDISLQEKEALMFLYA